ncbi:Crp/Fnr family transcriptional regulator [Chryseobacterium echinoideorum]|uniref:Crp/Fnr family transcriptional regulator n=1 Tax=Chryseobacterium echinoideorum TaxID=1549648 RepID=UPI0016278C0A|nr:Crp/Fnr family transcriptional regulator [Chryseobacterium echinoideorum]
MKCYQENEIIFNEGGSSKYYFQIKEGAVKICNMFDEGKEFVHGFPFNGHCFGESYLLTDKPYAISAIALTDCTVILLSRQNYLELIDNNPNILINVNQYTADRLHFRYLISSFLAVSDPSVRIKKLLDHLKDYFGHIEPYTFQVPFTRYQLASLVGLRVETVIRIIKKMEAAKLLKINQTKIYY